MIDKVNQIGYTKDRKLNKGAGEDGINLLSKKEKS